MCVQSPISVSHCRKVESNPQLYALVWSVPIPKTAFETLPECDLRTVSGALRVARFSLLPSTRRRFLRSRSWRVSSGTSSESGMVVSQTPMKLSHDAVRMWEPEGLLAMEVNGPVWR